MFLILCSYVYLTCLPGFPTRFTDKDRCSNSLRIVYEYCAKTMGQSFNPDDLFTYSEEQVCVYPPHLDVHDLAVMACRWTEGCWFFVVKNKKTCGLSLKKHVVYIMFTSFFLVHPIRRMSPIPFQTFPFTEAEPSRGDGDEVSLARWLRHGDGQGGERLLGRCETGGDLGPRRLVKLRGPLGTLGDPYMLKDEKCWFYPDLFGVLCGFKMG